MSVRNVVFGLQGITLRRRRRRREKDGNENEFNPPHWGFNLEDSRPIHVEGLDELLLVSFSFSRW